MDTSFTGEVSSDRLTSCPGGGESYLSAKRHRNRRLAPTLWALWPEKTKTNLDYQSNAKSMRPSIPKMTFIDTHECPIQFNFSSSTAVNMCNQLYPCNNDYRLASYATTDKNKCRITKRAIGYRCICSKFYTGRHCEVRKYNETLGSRKVWS